MELHGVVQVSTLNDRADFHLPTFKPFPFHITLETDNKQGKHVTGQEGAVRDASTAHLPFPGIAPASSLHSVFLSAFLASPLEYFLRQISDSVQSSSAFY